MLNLMSPAEVGFRKYNVIIMGSKAHILTKKILDNIELCVISVQAY